VGGREGGGILLNGICWSALFQTRHFNSPSILNLPPSPPPSLPPSLGSHQPPRDLQNLQWLRREERKPYPRVWEMPGRWGGGPGREGGSERGEESFSVSDLPTCLHLVSDVSPSLPPSLQVQRTAFGITQTQVVCDHCHSRLTHPSLHLSLPPSFPPFPGPTNSLRDHANPGGVRPV